MRNNLKYRAKRQQLVLVQSSGTIEMCPLTAAALPFRESTLECEEAFFSCNYLLNSISDCKREHLRYFTTSQLRRKNNHFKLIDP